MTMFLSQERKWLGTRLGWTENAARLVTSSLLIYTMRLDRISTIRYYRTYIDNLLSDAARVRQERVRRKFLRFATLDLFHCGDRISEIFTHSRGSIVDTPKVWRTTPNGHGGPGCMSGSWRSLYNVS